MLDTPFHIRRLQHEIEIRKAKNSRYSLRAFAKYLGLGSSTLSRILSNQQELSQSACKNIIRKLKFDHDDTVLFISSIAEEKKRRAYQELFSLIEDGADPTPFQSFEWMLSNTPDLMFVFDKSGRIIHVNEPVSQFFQLPIVNIIGKTMDEIGMHKDISSKIKPSLKSVFENPRIEKVEECYETNGDSVCFEVTLVPVGHGKDLRAVACHWRDITERMAYQRLWSMDLVAAEILTANNEKKKALNIFSKQMTEHFCEACVIQMPDKKNIASGPETLTHIPDSNLLTLKKIEHDDRVINVPVFQENKEIAAVISFIRDKKRKPFTLKDFEFGRDMQLKMELFLR